MPQALRWVLEAALTLQPSRGTLAALDAEDHRETVGTKEARQVPLVAPQARTPNPGTPILTASPAGLPGQQWRPRQSGREGSQRRAWAPRTPWRACECLTPPAVCPSLVEVHSQHPDPRPGTSSLAPF